MRKRSYPQTPFVSDAVFFPGVFLLIVMAIVVVCLTACASPRGETHQPTFVTDRPAPPGRQGYMATWPDGSVSMIEWDVHHD